MPGESNTTCEQHETAPWSLILLLVGAGVVASFQVGKAPPVLPFIRVELGMNLFMAGWILSTFSITGLVFGPVIGAVADAFGHRRFVLWGLMCQAAASFLGSLASGAEWLLLTRVFEGFGFFMIAVAAPTMIFRITPVCHHRVALSVWSCYVPAGVAAIMLLAPLLTSRFGWRGLWQANTVILLAYGFWVMRATRGIVVFRGGKTAAMENRFRKHRIHHHRQRSTSSFRDFWQLRLAVADGDGLLTDPAHGRSWNGPGNSSCIDSSHGGHEHARKPGGRLVSPKGVQTMATHLGSQPGDGVVQPGHLFPSFSLCTSLRRLPFVFRCGWVDPLIYPEWRVGLCAFQELGGRHQRIVHPGGPVGSIGGSAGPGVGGCKCRRLACCALVPGVFSGLGRHVILMA